MTAESQAKSDRQTNEPAALLRRLAALAYDALLLTALIFVFTLLVVLARGTREIGPGTLWFEGSLVVIALLFIVINLVVDLLYAVLDPRIRYGHQ